MTIRIATFLFTMFAFSAAPFVSGAVAAEIVVHDAKSSPESLTMAPDGSVIAGSASSPYVYRVKKGATAAEVFVDASADGPGTSFLGQLADPATNMLWTCELTPTPGTTPPARRSSLRGFDLATGKEKLRWNLPGDNSVCNDFSIGPDKALYISDTSNAKIYRLMPGAQTADLFMQTKQLDGIDGLTFMDGVLYVNNVIFSKVYRIPVDASGKPGSGLDTPTGIEPAGDTLWLTERGVGKVWSIPMPK